jgi:hypothetical protein
MNVWRGGRDSYIWHYGPGSDAYMMYMKLLYSSYGAGMGNNKLR